MFKRVLLVKPAGKKGLGFASDIIPIGLEYIAAAIEGRVDDVRIVDMELERHPLQHFIDLFHPDLVGITMSATDHDEGLRLAKIAKINGITTVVGGYHPTSIPDVLLSYPQVDLVVRGEGEYTMRELVQKGSPDGVRGLSYKRDTRVIHNEDRPLIEDLDSLPFPARHLRRHKYSASTETDKERGGDVINTSRGCWGRCSFCCEPFMSRGRQRFRSPDNVIKELLEVVSFHHGKPLRIFVTDPNFIGNPKMIDRLCDLLYEHDLDIVFSVMARVDNVVQNPRLIKKMCKVGFLYYELGIESPNARDLNDTRKGTTSTMQRKAVKILTDNGAHAGGTFVIGLPGQTEEEIKSFPSYAKKIGLMGAAFGIATPFPGTEFYEALDKDGLIVERDWTKYDEMHSVFKLKDISRRRMEELATYCTAKFWTMDAFFRHAEEFMRRSGKKMTLADFMEEIFNKLKFGWSVGSDLQAQNLLQHMKIAVEASADPCVEEYMRKVGVHNIIDLSWPLKVLGSQTIQFTVKSKGSPITSYVIKTANNTVEYIRAIPGRQEDVTIDLDIDLDELDLSGDINLFKAIGNHFLIKASPWRITETWNKFRMLAALGVEYSRIVVFERVRALETLRSRF